MFNRVDNRGTHARGPLEYLNQHHRQQLAGACTRRSTLTYAGAFQSRRAAVLQRHLPAGAQRRRPDLFRQCQLWPRIPRPRRDQDFRSTTPGACTSKRAELPIIRARERNLSIAALTFGTEDRGIFFDLPGTPPSTLDRLRGFRIRMDGDSADSSGAINQFFFVFSQGIEGLGSTQTAAIWRRASTAGSIFTKMELTVSRLQPLFDQFSVLAAVYGQYALNAAAWYRNSAANGGRLFGRAFDPSQFVSDSCLELLASCGTIFPFN